MPKAVYNILHADVVKLAYTLDLGSSAKACRFKSCHPHQANRKVRFFYFIKLCFALTFEVFGGIIK